MRLAALLVVLLCPVLAGCAGAPFHTWYRGSEPGPAPHAPYGGDGTLEMVVVYFSFRLEDGGEGAFGDLGGHCGFDDWTLDPTTALVHVGKEAAPRQVVMREIHPDQSEEGVGHFGTAPTALWREGYRAIPRAIGYGEDHGKVEFGGGGASFHGTEVPQDRWLLVELPYTVVDGGETWRVTETLHMRLFRDVPVDFDRRELMCE